MFAEDIYGAAFERKGAESAAKYSQDEYIDDADMTAEELAEGKAIADFIDKVNAMLDESARSKRKLRVGRLSNNHAMLIEKLMDKIQPGFSAAGYELWIDGTGASHIEKRHGAFGKQDRSMANKEAKMLIPWASQNAERCSFLLDEKGNIKKSKRFLNSDGTRAPEISMEKTLNNDTVCVSECVPDSRNKIIWITSAYIKKGSTGQKLNMEETSPQPTPEAIFDSSATKDIVTLDGDDVKHITERFSADDGEQDYDALDAEFAAKQREAKEAFLRERLGDKGYEQYLRDREDLARQKKEDNRTRDKVKRKVETNRRKLRLEAETAKVNKMEEERLREETAPTKARKALKDNMLNLFSIPNGQRSELGKVVETFADRILKNGTLTEQDRKAFFDRMYESGAANSMNWSNKQKRWKLSIRYLTVSANPV